MLTKPVEELGKSDQEGCFQKTEKRKKRMEVSANIVTDCNSKIGDPLEDWLSGKESPSIAGDIGDRGSIPGFRKIPWRRKWQPTPGFLLEKSHAQRSLVGYSLWGPEESDMTEATEHAGGLQSSMYTICWSL